MLGALCTIALKNLILISLLLLNFASRSQNSITEVFLIPKDYTGFVYVIFEQPNSSNLSFKKNTRTYDIPQDGVLITTAKPNFNITNQLFYYTDSLGKRIQIPKQKTGTSIVPGTPVVTYFGSINLYSYSEKEPGGSLYYMKFVISTNTKEQEISSMQYQLEFEKKVSLKLGKKFSTIGSL